MLGMPFIFEQPNLDRPSESHLYFDPGDGRLITVFTDESQTPVARRTPGADLSYSCWRRIVLASEGASPSKGGCRE
ncbi:hypothetical protein MESS2_1470001 [Mesorhizobium metallidurans STM 2683]|uniref:Uncharacterized protein n=1 Tax=Mesorhizobium metallidurans STM 2683 TaxID=1297569 RepID=M5ELA7_9HYPH|nr:hypothetical protein MESS2_1470001 [Mesorhizobium metallidurans STM 2683]